MFRQAKLATRFMLLVGGSTTVLLAAAIFLSAMLHLSQVRADSFAQSREFAYRYSNAVKAEVDYSLDTARTLAQTFEGMKQDQQPSREMLDHIMQNVLTKESTFLAVWTIWEPNALDGRDAWYVHARGHNASGQYHPYWNRHGGTMAVEPIENFSSADYYILPKTLGREVVTDPYLYPLSGVEVPMVSSVAPIFCAGIFCGVAGVDIQIDRFQQLIEQARPYEIGLSAIVANNGAYAAHTDKQKILKTIDDPKALQAIREGRLYEAEGYSDFFGAAVWTVYVPVAFGNTRTPWAFAVYIPMEKILEQYVQARNFSIAAGCVLLLSLLAMMVVLAGSISRPVSRLAEAAKKVAGGDLTTSFPACTGKELMLLSACLEAMRTSLIAKINESAEKTAETEALYQQAKASEMLIFQQYKELKSGAEALRESEQRVRTVIDNTPVILYAYDNDGVCTLFEGSGIERVGLKAGQLVGVSLFSLQAENHPTVVNARKVLAGESVQAISDIAGHYFEYYSEPLRDESGRIVGAIGVALDITERRKAELEREKVYKELENRVEERTQELFAANEELTAMNEEVRAMNDSLIEANEKLTDQAESNSRLAGELAFQKRQIQATTSLFTNADDDLERLLKGILVNVQQIIKAPGSCIGIYAETGDCFAIRYTLGILDFLNEVTNSTGAGMNKQVRDSGEMCYVENYKVWPQRLADPHFDIITTIAIFPLKAKRRQFGTLIVAWDSGTHPLGQGEIEVLQQFCDLASLAYERSVATSSLAEKNRLLQGLAITTTALMNQKDLKEVLQEIMRQTASLLSLTHGAISMFDDDGDSFRLMFSQGRFAELGDGAVFRGALTQGIQAEVQRTGRRVYVRDYQHWPQRRTGGIFDDITMLVVAPLKVDEKIIGTIGFAAFGEEMTLAEEKLAIFDQYAATASIAVKNAQIYQQTLHQAMHDSLTGLPNRASLNQTLGRVLEQACQGETAGTVLFVDMDDLKTINDSLGHAAGDDVIISTANSIVGSCGSDAVVARMGGDEFIVILPGETNRSRIETQISKMIEAIGREHEYAGQRLRMTASIGVTLYPQDGGSTVEILRNADNAMYAAKAAGKNCWRFYEAKMLQAVYDRMVITNSLRLALEKDELYLLFQPQVSLSTGEIVAFEALLRWRNQEFGLLPPDRFIPLAEQSGLIQPIGQWVIGQSCWFARRLRDMGQANIRVAVNVSPKQLIADDFVRIVSDCIDRAGIEPWQLEIEITENVLIEGLDINVHKLKQLAGLGVGVSLDDFGTGYSSLTYLRGLPVQTLKIDKSFVDDLERDKTQAGFFASIISMAHVLNLTVVAEGVETESQRLRLKELGCDTMQGFVFSRPVDETAAIRLLSGE